MSIPQENALPRLLAVPGRRVEDLPSGLLRMLRAAPSCAATELVFDLVELARIPAPTRRVAPSDSAAFSGVTLLAHGVDEHVAGLPLDGADDLAGTTVVVTRAAHQTRALAEKLEARGAAVIALPAIAIVPPEDPAALDSALRAVAIFDAVVFTSENGVARSFDRVRALGLDARLFAGRVVAAIGPGTAAALAREGLRADLMPEEHVGEALARDLDATLPRASRVLILRATEARDALPKLLREAGHAVTVVPAYTTERAFDAARFERVVARTLRERVRVAVTFTSASTARSVIEALDATESRQLLADCTLVSIGPITSAELRRLGLEVSCEASPYTLDGVVDALVRREDHQEP